MRQQVNYQGQDGKAYVDHGHRIDICGYAATDPANETETTGVKEPDAALDYTELRRHGTML